MKLITKTSRYYILFAFPVLLLAAFLSYWFMLHEIGESNETLLLSRMKVVEKQLTEGDSLVYDVFQEYRELQIKEIQKYGNPKNTNKKKSQKLPSF